MRHLGQLHGVDQPHGRFVEHEAAGNASFAKRQWIDVERQLANVVELGDEQPDLAAGSTEDDYVVAICLGHRMALNVVFEPHQRQTRAAILQATGGHPLL